MPNTAPKPKIASVADLPIHLKPYVVQQEPELYTPMDHASWRFIMKIATAFFAEHAHEKYLEGLKATGISLEKIPLITEMDEKLSKFGWHAVGVAGFIPPAIFLEFLSLGVLPIACDMRKFENIAYTPAPDIVHESAGHAPIIAAPDYALYLHNYGEVARRAIFHHKDLDLYEAIRKLSDVKEDPHSTEDDIAKAQKGFEKAYEELDVVSEATELARMSWWTIEYGLVGSIDDFKIYGAGLLSSVAESYNCLKDGVKKLPFDEKCIEQTYDITKPQPQLFVAKDFEQLSEVLEEFSKTMAYKRGGKYALDKSVEAKTVTTTQLDCGLQITGVLDRYDEIDNEVSCLFYKGPIQLAYNDQELRGLGPRDLITGFVAPIGKVKWAKGKSLFEMNLKELAAIGLKWNKKTTLEWESGYKIEGLLMSPVTRDGKRLALDFKDAILFAPNGEKLVSRHEVIVPTALAADYTFGGAADRPAYLSVTHSGPAFLFKHKSNLTAENENLNKAYAMMRKMRETEFSKDDFAFVIEQIKKHQNDWLIRYEVLEQEQNWKIDSSIAATLKEDLNTIAQTKKDVSDMIDRGKKLL